MIYRCTARFIRSFDKLEPGVRQQVTRSLRAFQASPRMPTRDAHFIRGAASDHDVWTLDVGERAHVTYSYHEDPRYDNDWVCLFRHVGHSALETDLSADMN